VKIEGDIETALTDLVMNCPELSVFAQDAKLIEALKA
jgi:hypothetical protein